MRERVAGPDLPHRTTAPASGTSAPSRTSPAVSTASPSSAPRLVAEVRPGSGGGRAAPSSRRPFDLRARLGGGGELARAAASAARVELAQALRLARRASAGRSNVAGSCGSGICALRTPRTRRTRAGAPRASRRRSSSSMWSEKNRNGAVSPYSSPWKSIGVNGARQVSSAASGRACDRQPVAEGAVADLVVVGGEDDEALAAARRRPARRSGARGSSRGAVVHVRAVERLGERAEVVELVVPAVGLAGEGDAQRVVEVVRPRGVAAQPPRRAGA